MFFLRLVFFLKTQISQVPQHLDGSTLLFLFQTFPFAFIPPVDFGLLNFTLPSQNIPQQIYLRYLLCEGNRQLGVTVFMIQCIMTEMRAYATGGQGIRIRALRFGAFISPLLLLPPPQPWSQQQKGLQDYCWKNLLFFKSTFSQWIPCGLQVHSCRCHFVTQCGRC